jgi:Ca-activated chloride channel homolog
VRFAASEWLWGAGLALVIAAVLIVQGFRLAKSKRAFGTPALIDALVTEQVTGRRSLRAVLLVLAVVFAAVAAAAPQYGRGTRVLPATNLDVVVVLDYSKSMYAKDVSPSRMKRAKVEVARLVSELGGARFGAVAFAGDTMAFPVTSDGAAIAQFFRGLEPVDMPIGGTSIARALETARELLARDPLSARHERVIVLVTDGEDLEGDPAEVAGRIAADGTRIEVVQIGGRTPEPMYEVDENGNEVGLRRDSQGALMTTFLTPEGEAQLGKVAAAGGGEVVRAEKGQVGIDHVTARLQKLMTEELSERVETVYADVYQYPLGATVFLLVLDVLLSLSKKRKLPEEPPRGVQRRRQPSRMRQPGLRGFRPPLRAREPGRRRRDPGLVQE